MHRLNPTLLTALGAVWLSSPALAVEATATRNGSILRLAWDGKTICDYQMEPGATPEGVPAHFQHGAHLHPIFSPTGKIVTGNHQPDHPWQRGVWIAWTKTDFAGKQPDFWNMGKGGKIMAEVRFEQLEKTWSGATCGFVSRHLFLDHHRQPGEKVLDESWEVRASQLNLEGTLTNVIDLTSLQTCAGPHPLRLPKYHYGGLGVRGNPAWNGPDAVTMLTSEGLDRAKGDASKARWVYLGGNLEGGTAGLAVLIHPSNFRFPQPLRLNPSNPQLCIAPSQDGDWSIEPGKPLRSRYRLLVFDGKPDPGWLQSQWTTYSKLP